MLTFYFDDSGFFGFDFLSPFWHGGQGGIEGTGYESLIYIQFANRGRKSAVHSVDPHHTPTHPTIPSAFLLQQCHGQVHPVLPNYRQVCFYLPVCKTHFIVSHVDPSKLGQKNCKLFFTVFYCY